MEWVAATVSAKLSETSTTNHVNWFAPKAVVTMLHVKLHLVWRPLKKTSGNNKHVFIVDIFVCVAG